MRKNYTAAKRFGPWNSKPSRPPVFQDYRLPSPAKIHVTCILRASCRKANRFPRARGMKLLIFKFITGLYGAGSITIW